MSRRHSAKKREINADAKYSSVVLSKFINNIMHHGKKSIAEKIVYKSFERMKKRHGVDDAFQGFLDAISNVKPHMEVSSVRVGGANYQVPSIVSEERGKVLSMRWLIDASRKRSGKSMIEKLSDELFDAMNSRGLAIKKKEDTHKMAEANKAFAHFAQR